MEHGCGGEAGPGRAREKGLGATRSAAVLLWRRVSASSSERRRPGTFSQSMERTRRCQGSVSVCELRIAIC